MKNLKITAYLILLCCVIVPLTDTIAQVLTEEMLENFTYRELGPTRQSGRYVDFAVPLQQPYTFYAATGSGGLWKTVNNGQSFEPIFDEQNVISIGDVTVAPSDPNIVWVGTGEANNSRSTYWGDGVYKSTDAGETWTNMGLPESHHIGRIVIHPKNPDIVYVAALGHLYTDNEERGLYKTTNGGRSWTKSLDVVERGKNIGVVDVVIDPKNPNTLYAAAYDKVRVPFSFDLGGPGSGIYKTTNAGKSWTKLTNGLPGGMLGRIGLTIFPDNPKILYANIENANKDSMSDEERYRELMEHKASRGMINGEVYRTDNAGKSWTKVSPDDLHVGGSPGYYYGRIIVDPHDADHVYVLSIRVTHSTDGGKTWGSPFRFGGDNHALWINPDNSNHMLLGYDHGMGVTFDAGQNWYHPDNIPLAQFYAIGVDMDYPYNVYGGLQDNGSKKGPSTGRGGPVRFEDWSSVGGGDGFYNEIDPVDSRWLYNESQFGRITRHNQKTGESVSISPQDSLLRFNWSTPIHISPHNPRTIFVGTNKLMRSNNRGDSWEAISEDLTTNDPMKLTTGKGGDGNIQYCTITSISESPIEPGLIYVGADDGNVQMTRDGGKTWTKLNDKIRGNPGYWVSRVIASNHYNGTAYVTYTGLRRDDFRAFVYKTTNYGETWTSISNNLPEESVNVIKEDHKNPDLLFVGTDKAVYVTVDGGRNWVRMRNNMPNNPVHDLIIHPRENDLVVGTHGRGIFIANIKPLQELTRSVTDHNAWLFEPKPKVRWERGINRNYGSHNFNGRSESNGIEIFYYIGSDLGSEVTISVYKGVRLINKIKGVGTAGINKVTWNMSQRIRARTEEEKERFENQRQRFSGGRFRRGGGGGTDPDWITGTAPAGEYIVKLAAGGTEITKKAVILQDIWVER